MQKIKKKAIGIFVCMLLIASTVLPVAGTVNNNENIVIENQTQVGSEPQYGATSRVDDEWPMFLHDLENTGYSTSTAPQTNTIKWTYTTGWMVTSSPAVVNGKVYIGSNDENFYCLDAETGQKLWSYYIEALSSCSPAVYDGKVYIGSDHDYFYCFDADSGGLIWTFLKNNYGFSSPSPAVVDGKVYFAHARGGGGPGSGQNASLYCLDADTGIEFWDYPLGYFDISSPAVYNGKVYIGSADNKVYCFDADTGSILWDFNAGNIVMSSPAVFDHKVYFGSYDNKLYCLDADTGDFVWSYTAGSPIKCSPTVAYNQVYFTSFEDNMVYCLDAETGDLVWSYTTGGNMLPSAPAVADGKLYVGVWGNGMLLCLDAYTGEFIWDYPVGAGIQNSIWSSPAVAYGRIYMGGGLSNNVYCFEDPSRPPDPPTIDGPTEGLIDHNYEFGIRTTDPEGDNVRYYVDWGDGNTSGWIGPYPSGEEITVSHTWGEPGTYSVRARAEDTYGIKSHWSELHSITIIEGALLEIQPIKGGLFKVSTVIENLGGADATNVNWSITLDGGFILLGRETTGTIDSIPIDGEASVSSDFILGFGSITIMVNATISIGFSDTREQKGFVFLSFIIVKSGE